MNKLSITLLLLLSISVSSFAQKWEKELKKELVIIEEGKLKSTDYTLISMNNGNSMQIKSYAEASNSGFISRDQFVALFASTATMMIQQILTEAGLTENDYRTTTIDELIGSADIVLNLYMGKNGLQIEMKASGETNRITQTWEDIFK